MKHQKQKLPIDDDLQLSAVSDAGERRLHPLIQKKENAATFSLENGCLSIAFNSTSGVREGDAVDLYAGDYHLGAGQVTNDQDSVGLLCKVGMHHAPSFAFPASLRAVLLRLNEEISPGLTIPTLHAFQANMGRHGLELSLAYVQDMALGFDLKVDCLAVYPRSLTLHLGGRAPATARSELPKYKDSPESLVHSVVFPLTGPVRDGMSIEIIDDATGAVVFETTLTWMNLINPVLVELRSMHRQQEGLTKQLDGMHKQILASADPGRERLMLQRLDLTYMLLNERMDREMKWLSGRIDGADSDRLIAEHLSESTQPTVQVSPSGLQGVGIYDSESNGVDAWRWFSRTVTVFLTEVNAGARALRFHFNAPTHELDLSRMNVTSNGYEAPFDWTYPEGKWNLSVALSSLSSRPDGTLIVTIDFGQGWSAENDGRILTLACTGLDVES